MIDLPPTLSEFSDNDADDPHRLLKRLILTCECLFVRTAAEHPRSLLVDSGVTDVKLQANGYRALLAAILRLLPHTVGAVSRVELVNELAKHMRYGANVSPDTLAAELYSYEPVSVEYALDTLAREILIRYEFQLWNARMKPLYDEMLLTTEPIVHMAKWMCELGAASRSVAHVRVKYTTPATEAPWDPTKRPCVPLNVRPIDSNIGGGVTRGGGMLLVGGGTTVGKSYCAEWLQRMQCASDTPSAYFSFEDPPELMECRSTAAYAKTPFEPRLMLEGKVDPVVLDRARGDRIKAQGARAIGVDARGWNVERAAKTIQYLAATKGVRLVIVDYIQAVAANDPNNNKAAEIGSIVHGLKEACREANVALVAFSQLTRESYKDGEEPELQSFKYSGDLENETDIAALLWRDADDNLHLKLPKVKWAKGGQLRFLVCTNAVSGCYESLETDYSPTRVPSGGSVSGRATSRRPPPRAG